MAQPRGWAFEFSEIEREDLEAQLAGLDRDMVRGFLVLLETDCRASLHSWLYPPRRTDHAAELRDAAKAIRAVLKPLKKIQAGKLLPDYPRTTEDALGDAYQLVGGKRPERLQAAFEAMALARQAEGALVALEQILEASRTKHRRGPGRPEHAESSLERVVRRRWDGFFPDASQELFEIVIQIARGAIKRYRKTVGC